MRLTDAQQAALYFARKRRKIKTAKISSVTDLTVVEGAENDTVVGQFQIVPQFGATAWELTDNANGRFALSSDGELTVADGEQLVFDDAQSHDVTVQATDGFGNVFTTTVAVQVTEAP